MYDLWCDILAWSDIIEQLASLLQLSHYALARVRSQALLYVHVLPMLHLILLLDSY